MTKVSLRVKFLAVLLLGVLAVTAATLLVVRRTVDKQIRAELSADLRNSVVTFNIFQTEREMALGRSAELLASLPTVKALMTTEDVQTIQDASKEIWRIGGKDLLVLAGTSGRIMAVHATAREITPAVVQESFTRSLGLPADKQWWLVGGHLYEVAFQPIYFGRSSDDRLLGVLALGYEINEKVAEDVSRIAGSQVAFLYGKTVVATTIAPFRQAELTRAFHDTSGTDHISAQDVRLGNERYLGASVDVTPGPDSKVCLSVLKSYDQATAKFRGLYRTLLALGLFALLGESLLAFAIFRRYTKPLEQLVGGVRALGKGDFAYPVDVQGNDELAEVTASFIRMRDDLQQTKRLLIDSERLATIGRMASSISHDLRHQLTAVVANAEFLSEPNLDPQQSEELYQEIRDAVGRMTELIESLLEFSKPQGTLSRSYGSLEETMQRAIRSVERHPCVQNVDITLSSQGSNKGWFDSRKMERVFSNLLLNACQAVPAESGKIEVIIKELPLEVEINISDNCAGIPEHLCDKIFEPFVSYGKENGTGLGLTIAHKIVEEHGGTIELTDSSPGRTNFQIRIPLGASSEADGREEISAVTSNNTASGR